MEKLRIFVSSPGDVGRERLLSRHVIARLRGEYGRRVDLEAYFWEHEPMRGSTDFTGTIPDPSAFDIVVCILWSRLGSPLNENYRKADGSPYASGTEYEFEVALAGRLKNGKPEILVYRNEQEPTVPIEPASVREEKIRQYEALKAFLQKWFFNPDGSFRLAWNSYKGLDDFGSKLEDHLRKIIDEKAPALAPRAAPVAFGSYSRGSPFRSLQPFRFEDADIFFGRTKAIDDVLNALQNQAAAGTAFALIFGSSGSGKSSLVRAGVIPLLVQPGAIEGIGLWRRAEMRPSAAAPDIFFALANALVSATALPEVIDGGVTAQELADALRKASGSISLVLKTALTQVSREVQAKEHLPLPPSARLVLLIDQFEELFTLTDRFSAETQKGFVTALAELARSGVVWVIATVRSEFFGQCETIPELVRLKSGKGEFQLLPPTRPELSQIIRLPAIASGLEFETDRQSGANLDDALLEAAGHDSGALPILEFTLDELYKRRSDHTLTYAAFKTLKGVEGALETKAEEVFNQVPPEIRGEFDFIFRALVTVDLGEGKETAFTRRIAVIEELATTTARRDLIEAFVDGRLLVTDTDQQNRATVQIAHEALFEHWPRLRTVLEASLEFLRRRARAGSAFALWKEKDDRSYLWTRGKSLAEAQDLLAHQDELTLREAEFARASVQAGQAVRWKGLAAVIVVTLIVLGAAAMGYRLWKKSQSEAEVRDLRAQLARVLAEPNSHPYEVANLSQRIIERSAGDSEAWAAYAKALLDQGDFESFRRALGQWEENVSPPPARIDALRGDEEAKRGHLHQAIKYWSGYLGSPKLTSDEREKTWEKLARASASLGQWIETKAFLTDWIMNKDNVHARLLRAEAGRQLRDWQAAQQDLDRARELAPNSPAVKNFPPIVSASMIAPLDAKIQRSPRDGAAWLERARVLLSARQFEAALSDAETALKLMPDSVEALEARAEINRALNRISAAEADRRQAEELKATQEMTPHENPQ